ncbi:inorganic pyrophosphatase [Tsukamurella sp. PLM1]|uniref:inorganic pyrophosphatase n=1 Tax=Tsukamurella sp. PLM1 TaxID=2929795 RepID=UPI002047903E|nr:inorganic pyrophosphatase [Tsukamurella sp. PLM1]BDH55079.1 hypothetical protein MTP03_00180 [Tsukamurella sp. PLM1]
MTDHDDQPLPASVEFFEALDALARTSQVVIDRPAGTTHPRIPEAIYPLDYGYLDGTTSGDGDGIDVFVGTATGVGVVAVLLTADVKKRDAEIKLLFNCTAAEVEDAQSFLSGVLGISGHLVTRKLAS